ncbi:MAG: DNA recombination protein RmuC [Eubacteriales bacterium]|jgi:DNA recombination protein RmuC
MEKTLIIFLFIFLISFLAILIFEKTTVAKEKNKRINELELALKNKDNDLFKAQENITGLKEKIAQTTTLLEKERNDHKEKLILLEEAKESLSGAFKVLSADALRVNNQTFLELATTALEKYQESAKNDLEARQKAVNEIVRPVQDSLEKVDLKIYELEKSRLEAYTGLTRQVEALSRTQDKLKLETSNLVNALRTPNVRGRWGEIQLKRVVEIAGMVEYCDFIQQESVNTEQGRLRPDLVVKLPNNRNIIIDSKAPILAYIESLEVQDEKIKDEKIKEHARNIRTHLAKLGSKSYWSQFDPSPEFVVLFLPREAFFSAALEHEPGLIEFGVEQHVVIATPTTLIALLHAVAYGWKQEKLAENAKAISILGNQLYERLRGLAGYFSDLKKGLDNSIEAYNRAVGALESRVLVSARKFKEYGAASGNEIKDSEIIEKDTRTIQNLELIASVNSEESD